MINKVASDVIAVLAFTPSTDFDDFVGVRARIIEIKSMLIQQPEEVKVIGVVGLPGIGKTTTARALFNQLSPGFPFSTFLDNIRGSSEKPCGNDYQTKLCFHKKMLSQIFNQRDIEVPHLGVVHQMLSDKKLLVVLDEVDSSWQLEAMENQRGWFGPGSMIIITTEDRKLLEALGLGTNHIYEMKLPTTTESFQIFCKYAFGKKSPDRGFERLAWEVTGLCGDLPIGLKVTGSYLRRMPKEYWIDALPRLRSSLNTEIESVLRLSYNSLDDDKDKALFLYTACFFSCFDCKVDRVKSWLEKSGLDANHGLQVLTHKSLITIENGYVKMHTLLQQMGKEIVKNESLEEPGARKFLMDTNEISYVLKEDTGTGKVLGILLCASWWEKIQISKSAFDGMGNLQFLKIDSRTLCIPEGLNCLPDKLRLIDWGNCPLRIWPSKFSGKFLVELIMLFSKFEKLWEGIKPLYCLKRMNLMQSQSLKKIPDLSEATSLEKLDLSSCKSLVDLTSSIGNATKLTSIKLGGCFLLKELPSSIGSLINLEELDLGYTAIEKMPSSLSTWSRLYRLDIKRCTNIKDFPDVPNSIVELDLSGTGIEEVPPSIGNLFRLRKLVMCGCAKLKTISPNISKLENLEVLVLCKDSEDGEPESVYKLSHVYSGRYVYHAAIKWRGESGDLQCRWELLSDLKAHYIFPICLPETALSSPISLSLTADSLETISDCIRSISRLIKLHVVAFEKTTYSRYCGHVIGAAYCESLKRVDTSFQNPNISLNFYHSFNLMQKARDLTDIPAWRYAFLPGKEVHAHFTHRARSDSLRINLTPGPLPSSFKFKACILLSEGHFVKNSLMEVAFSVRNKQNGHIRGRGSTKLHIPNLCGYDLCEEHLYIFEGTFSQNHDCPEAEEATFFELNFVFRLHDKTWKVKGCGLRLLKEDDAYHGPKTFLVDFNA